MHGNSDDRGAETVLPGFDATAEVVDLLTSLLASIDAHDPVDRAVALRRRLGEAQGFEARRVVEARAALDGWLGLRKPASALLRSAEAGERRFALTFGGQASAFVDELAGLVRRSPAAARLVGRMAERLRDEVAGMEASDRAWYGPGFDLPRWLSDPSSRPPAVYLTSSQVSQPLIFATQVGHYVALLEAGFDREELWQHTVGASGHSQGIMAAVLVSETWGRSDLVDRGADYSAYMLFQGLRMQQGSSPAAPPPELVAAAREAGVGDPTPMAGITGLTTEEIERAIARLGLPLSVTLDNGRVRKVVSGRPIDLEPLRRCLLDEAEARVRARARGRHAGALPKPQWQYLPVTVPFHCQWMEPGARAFEDDLQELRFAVDGAALRLPVLDTATAANLQDHPGLLQRLVEQQFLEPVRWVSVLAGLRASGADTVLDFGPGDTVFRLDASNYKGHGVTTLGLALDEHRAAALDPDRAPKRPRAWAEEPERWTRWTNSPRVFLPGMTPTTVEAPIVAAAANAGFVAELAGGGQVTEPVLRQRLAELQGLLEPGRGVVFNALYLDPYLWRLHLGEDRLLLRLRDEGSPVVGLTVSAGIPPVDEAVALLRELHAHGLWLNAFKPGTDDQIRQVLAIADAVPDLVFAAHVEGGRAGGHHSWEDLADVVSRNYEAMRSRRNLVLAVGGGIGTPEQAHGWLDGTWSEALGFARMPVDAVFVGTVCMAAREACTSPQVKAALVQCAGTARPVLEGGQEGGVRSGRSHLDADIHYLDNAASRCGALLDEVSRAPETLETRRAEVVEALSRTAKPWFGDLRAMTWLEVLGRYVDLTTPWVDVTHRDRLAALVRLAEARLTEVTVPSFLQDEGVLDDPSAFLETFLARWPAAAATRLHPDDVASFLGVCRRPGKPVPFVPVIDADVRRWFKSDSLWQAHDPRFEADAVLVIPGPAAVSGITRADEPIALLLARFSPLPSPIANEDPLLAARDVALPGGRLARNPARRMLEGGGKVTRRGDTVALDTGDGRELDLCLRLDGGRVVWDRDAFLRAQRTLWSMPAGNDRDPWRPAIVRTTLTRERITGFALATGDDSRGICDAGAPARAPLAMTFALAWEAIFRALDATRPDLLALVHEDQACTTGPGWPLREGDAVDVVARVVAVEGLGSGRRVVVAAELFRAKVLCAELRSSFFVRGEAARTDLREPLRATLRLPDEASRDVLLAQPWFRPAGELPLNTPLVVSCPHQVTRSGGFESRGVVRCGRDIVGRIELLSTEALEEHPVAALCRLFEDTTVDRPLSSVRDLGSQDLVAPVDLKPYAAASGDHNPIHLLEPVARLAGHPSRIVHGMWTAAAAAHRVAHLAAGGDAGRLLELKTRFLAPVLPGDRLEVSVRHVAMRDGARILELDVAAVRGDERTTVLAGTARVRPPRTAYVFPGQGLQQQGMGMGSYARSAPARAIWDRADEACRERLGFSLLRVVRENPRHLAIGGEHLQHPAGVLHITRFTQVALVVMALAQVAELEDEGTFVRDAMFCGHSLGEHSALGVFARGLPLEGLVEIVYHRGCAMDELVERDATGRSPYAMGAVRPHHAGLNEASTRALVQRVAAETGLPLEIVNLNVRGRQYAVTGHQRALDRLRAELDALQAARPPSKEKKAPYVEIQGIDVPFHSSLLRDGVAMMRATLQRTWPETVDPTDLVGRYVPNLVAAPFRIDRDYIEQVVALTGTPELDTVLADWDTWRAAPGLLARAVLVELLAWQFAMPVRWIETQDVLLHEADGVEEIVEIGLAEQPILSNMALQTRSLSPYARRTVRILNSEGHHADLYGPPGASPAPAAAPARAPAPETPVAAPVPRPAIATTSVDDAPVTVAEGLRVLLALQAKLRVDQLGAETLDELLGGNSARRNQVLADVNAEFGAPVPDGAHELPIALLAAEMTKRATAWRAPGRYLGAAVDQALGKALGAARIDRAAVLAHLERVWGLGSGRATAVLLRIPLWIRDGASGRGGALSAAPAKGLADKASAERWLDAVVAGWASETGLSLARSSAGPSASAAVDSGALRELEGRLIGDEGLLARAGRLLAGVDPAADPLAPPAPDPLVSRVESFEREHDADYEAATAARFDADRHLALTSAWAWIRRDRWLGRERPERWIPSFVPTAPRGELSDRGWTVTEVPRPGELDLRSFVAARGLPHAVRASLSRVLSEGGDFRGRIALVTGASPGSIALEVVKALLAGGARVILTTSTVDPARSAAYKAVFQDLARDGAELHVVPFNQGSFVDVDALLAWLERVGDVPWIPDLLVPFAASTGLGHLDPTPRSLSTLRVLLLGVERLVARIAAMYASHGVRDRRCHVVLPLSPNHGTFGGDGAYGESKAALETLLARWRSEHAVWGRWVSLAGAEIGWVRGTGLMNANDVLAERLEAQSGCRTFSTAEMGLLLVGLLGDEVRAAAAHAPLRVDLTGGLDRVADLAAHVSRLRAETEATAARHRRRRELEAALRLALRGPERPPILVRPKATPRVTVPVPTEAELAALPELDHLDPRHVVVVVGYGEVGPWGSARTRWAIERDGLLSLEAAAELGWMMGLVKPRPDGSGWADAKSGEAVDDADLVDRYAAQIHAHAGIRVIEPELMRFDPTRVASLLDVHLDQDFAFPVPTRELAEQLRAADPEHTAVVAGPGQGFTVVRRRGAVVRVPRALRFDRGVGGQIPTGWDPRSYGVSAEMADQVDRATLFVLVATAEAFVTAGLTPEEVLAHLHPTRVGSTQSSGMGGMRKIGRMHRDLFEGNERQTDVLQEGLINVMVGYVVQSWLGSYGPMSFPVAACATAAVSLADAVDKIRMGQADLVIAGATDDYTEEGSTAFADMAASASSDASARLGIPPSAMSRPNDRRRAGFVEAHGAGACVVCRGSVALELGLPVYAIVAYAGSFGDGLNRSVPAPGVGPLGSACSIPGPAPALLELSLRRRKIATLRASREHLASALGDDADRVIEEGARHLGHDFWRDDPTISPLQGSLAVLGLTADDLLVASKHDTSTPANDLNENRLHQALQDRLGRTPGQPILVVSQKSLTGHPKGAAAGWQLNGLMQLMAEGVVPGNPNLDDVDPDMAGFPSLLFTDRPLTLGRAAVRCGLVTSLGFGHVGALVALAHPFLFWRMLSPEQRSAWEARLHPRLHRATATLQAVLSGREPLFVARTRRPFAEKDGTEEQQAEEMAKLTDGRWRPGRP